MNRTYLFGIALGIAVLGVALLGTEKRAVAGDACAPVACCAAPAAECCAPACHARHCHVRACRPKCCAGLLRSAEGLCPGSRGPQGLCSRTVCGPEGLALRLPAAKRKPAVRSTAVLAAAVRSAARQRAANRRWPVLRLLVQRRRLVLRLPLPAVQRRRPVLRLPAAKRKPAVRGTAALAAAVRRAASQPVAKRRRHVLRLPAARRRVAARSVATMLGAAAVHRLAKPQAAVPLRLPRRQLQPHRRLRSPPRRQLRLRLQFRLLRPRHPKPRPPKPRPPKPRPPRRRPRRRPKRSGLDGVCRAPTTVRGLLANGSFGASGPALLVSELRVREKIKPGLLAGPASFMRRQSQIA